MELKITSSPSFLTGKVRVPSSKSQSIRGLLFALLAKGTSALNHVLESEDTRDALQVVQALGAQVVPQQGAISLTSSGAPLMTSEILTLNTGNSGITTHFILPILGLRQNSDTPIVVDCGSQMRARPIQGLVTALRNLGLSITYLKEEHKLPIQISGRLMGGNTQVEGLTSQYISALLMSLPCAPHNSCLTVQNLHERSYMEMTLACLEARGIHFTHTHHDQTDTFTIQGGQHYQPFSHSIPGDFSSASYVIAAGVLCPGTIEVQGLNMGEPQGDKRLIPILQNMGADIVVSEDSIVIHGGKPLQGRVIDANDIPDLLPTLAVIGTYAQGQTHLTNVPHARIKETDRIHSMTQGLRKMGAHIEEHTDGMTIYTSQLKGAHLNGYGDHRTVMALALAGLIAQNETLIEGSEAIHKTFPNFVSTLRTLGATMEVQDE